MANYQIPTATKKLDEPVVEFIEEVCGIYFRSVFLKQTGTIANQHSHDYDHATYVGSGKVRYWVEGEWKDDVEAGHAIEILAGKSHIFMSLEPNTRLTCVHDLNSVALIKARGL